ncbi:holo-ACP synthase [Flexilinea flocculi]|uniref:Holo-[acyl-carrier-protein] synthase n=1 Tax=Flexilinea flocculi TaxID=1678840 RepID=A0A0K8P9J6_9CHLR|nr:holo-ACP synthase [Flexilinea flocculi]GAP39332.1 holo-[acyl-carrier-protein] synthase [Flexilinea flocculi]
MASVLRTGIDLIEVHRIANLKPEIRSRFLARVYTEAELEYCGGRNERLSGRFACKEAVSKALGTGIGTIGWQEIEILNDSNGMPILFLHGKATQISETLGILQWSVSISHIRNLAVAMAVGTG